MIAFIPGLCPFDDIIMLLLCPAVYVWLKRKFKWCKKSCDCPCHEEPADPAFVITKIVNGQDYYLRFCSTTGEPIWEDRLTPSTELYSLKAANHEIHNYFLTGVFGNNCKAKLISKSSIPTEYPKETKSFYAIAQ